MATFIDWLTGALKTPIHRITRVRLQNRWYVYTTYFDKHKDSEPYIVFRDGLRIYLNEEDCVIAPINWSYDERHHYS